MSLNAYISFKRVRRLPNDAQRIAHGTNAAGWRWSVSLGNVTYPHLFVTLVDRHGEPAGDIAVSLSRLVDDLTGSLAAAELEWEPLECDSQPAPDGGELWGNAHVTVHLYRIDEHHYRISYHRRDRAPIRDWRVGQRIKNELCGAEWEAVELYPAESRLVDEANEYHLFAISTRFPFGDSERTVQTQDDAYAMAAERGDPDGAVQRDPVVEVDA